MIAFKPDADQTQSILIPAQAGVEAIVFDPYIQVYRVPVLAWVLDFFTSGAPTGIPARPIPAVDAPVSRVGLLLSSGEVYEWPDRTYLSQDEFITNCRSSWAEQQEREGSDDLLGRDQLLSRDDPTPGSGLH